VIEITRPEPEIRPIAARDMAQGKMYQSIGSSSVYVRTEQYVLYFRAGTYGIPEVLPVEALLGTYIPTPAGTKLKFLLTQEESV
jgi:hypothetical protein